MGVETFWKACKVYCFLFILVRGVFSAQSLVVKCQLHQYFLSWLSHLYWHCDEITDTIYLNLQLIIRVELCISLSSAGFQVLGQ